MSNLLTISPSPHAKGKDTIKTLMGGVLIALAPAFLCSLYFFGLGALITTLVSVISCVLFEWLITKFILKQTPKIADLSAVLTGVLLAFNLPSNISPFIVMFGALIAIGVGKMSFGGLGQNPFNPALVGRVFLLISFPVQMTSWPLPIENRLNYLDAVTGATPMSHDMLGKVDTMDLLFGATGGSLGEVAAFALIIGGIYMICRKIITWHIPVSIIGTVAVLTTLGWLSTEGFTFGRKLDTLAQMMSTNINPLYHLFGGGLMLGAIFMATDYVTSPMSDNGKIIYGIGIGVLTVVIRYWGSYPEGMSFAILLMNALTPIINKYVKPTRFGVVKTK